MCFYLLSIYTIFSLCIARARCNASFLQFSSDQIMVVDELSDKLMRRLAILMIALLQLREIVIALCNRMIVEFLSL